MTSCLTCTTSGGFRAFDPFDKGLVAGGLFVPVFAAALVVVEFDLEAFFVARTSLVAYGACSVINRLRRK
jgi:hypothetical protein